MFCRFVRGYGLVGLCVRYGRQAQKRIFQDIYFSAEETDGVGVLYTKTGEYSAVLKIENPVQKYSRTLTVTTTSHTCSPPLRRRWAKGTPSTSRTSSSGNSLRANRLTVRSSCLHPIFVISRGASLHGQPLLPDHHARGEEKAVCSRSIAKSGATSL